MCLCLCMVTYKHILFYMCVHLLQRIEKRKVMQPTLYVCYKHLPEDVDHKAVYFIRCTTDPITTFSSIQLANEGMLQYFEVGTLSTSSTLVNLQQLMQLVYIPLLKASGQRHGDGELKATAVSSRPASRVSFRADKAGKDSGDETEEDEQQSAGTQDQVDSRMKMFLRDELVTNVEKFASHLEVVIKQVEGEVKLEIPDITIAEEAAIVARQAPIVIQLEAAMEGWSRVISNTVESILKKAPRGSGPLAEIDFWKERNSALGALSEQLKLPQVQKILEVLKLANVASLSNFEYHRNEMSRYFIEARDNVKFLTTLERHFKNITHGAGFPIVTDTIPSMMNALRMVWVISRHYNRDERMVPLMERIAGELCERVTRAVDIRTVFK